MSQTNRKYSIIRWVVETLLLAAAVFSTGTLALNLILPEGLLSPFWPPAGIALAALWARRIGLWPGVLIGSVAMSLLESVSNDLELTALVIVGLFILAAGATLQAVAGALLLRRFTGYDDCFGSQKKVLMFFVFGGLVSALISPTIDVITLAAADVVKWAHVPILWATSYIGDLVGIWVVAPLVLMFIARPTEIWKPRRLTVGAPLLLVGLCVVMLFEMTVRWEQQRQETQFDNHTRPAVLALHNTLHDYANLTHALGGFFDASEFVSRAEFAQFVSRFGFRIDGIQALEWAPIVPGEQREEYEKRFRQDGYLGFRIRERNSQGSMVAAEERDYYVPVEYVEPKSGNEAALGFDLNSEVDRRRTLEFAAQVGDVAVSAPLKLVQDRTEGYGFLLVTPVYDQVSFGFAPSQRDVRGYVLGAFQAAELVSSAIAGLPVDDIQLAFSDVTDADNPTVFCEKCFAKFEQEVVTDRSRLGNAVQRTYSLTFGGRKWELIFTGEPSYRRGQRALQTWYVLLAGMLFTGLLSMFLLSLNSRANEIERKVDERTAQLKAAIDKMRRQEEQLRHSNEELQHFAFVASHDLREPLRKVESFGSLISRKYEEVLDDTGRDYLARMASATQRMHALIEALLEYSRVSSQGKQFETVDLSEVFAAVCEDFEEELKAAGAKVDVQRLPMLDCDDLQIRQLFVNLLTNSLKYRKQDRPLLISVSSHMEPDSKFAEITYQDNGIGFDDKYAERIFRLFERLHGRKEYEGTGIGLAICRRIVERHFGRIQAQGVLDKGATFIIELPIRQADTVEDSDDDDD